MISLDFYNGEIIIRSSFDYKDRIKELSYRVWDQALKVWKTTVNNLDEVIDKFPEASLSENLKAFMLHREKIAAQSKAMESTGELDLGNFGKGKEILPFQKAGLEFIEMTGGRALLGDEMGTGKTVQSLAYLQIHPELRPAIIVCPASVKFNWRNEINQWLTTTENVVVVNNKEDISKSSIVVINYDILRKWLPSLQAINPKIIIFDESHVLKNPKAARTKAAVELSRKVNHVIELTGTPILNKPIELFSQLNIVNPKAYPEKSFFPFAKKYCNAHKTEYSWDFSGASNIKELAKEIKSLMIRRTKDQVLKELPPKRRTKVLLPITNRRNYDEALSEFRRWRRDEEKLDYRNALEWIETLKQKCTEGKLEAAKLWIKEFLETGNKLVLFCTHRIPIDFFRKEFGDCAVKIDGSTSQAERERAVYNFQNDDSTRLFIGNIRAAGVGITLTAASNVAFLEMDWTPALHDQAEDRCNRIGQKNSVNCYYLLAENTLDEDFCRMLENKREVIDQVLDEATVLNFAFGIN